MPSAAAIQAARCASCKARQRAVTLPRMRRTTVCAGERGLAGMASARLIWPNWPDTDTLRPRLPDCGMSSIFMCSCLSILFGCQRGQASHLPLCSVVLLLFLARLAARRGIRRSRFHPYGGKSKLPNLGSLDFPEGRLT